MYSLNGIDESTVWIPDSKRNIRCDLRAALTTAADPRKTLHCAHLRTEAPCDVGSAYLNLAVEHGYPTGTISSTSRASQTDRGRSLSPAANADQPTAVAVPYRLGDVVYHSLLKHISPECLPQEGNATLLDGWPAHGHGLHRRHLTAQRSRSARWPNAAGEQGTSDPRRDWR